MGPNLIKMFWDTTKDGDERARLTPWTIPAHEAFMEAQLKFVETAEGEEKAQSIKDAYRRKEKEYFDRMKKVDEDNRLRSEQRSEALVKQLEKEKMILEMKAAQKLQAIGKKKESIHSDRVKSRRSELVALRKAEQVVILKGYEIPHTKLKDEKSRVNAILAHEFPK